MTNHDDDFDTPPFWAETIDALVDGESVESGALRRALADPDAREYLVDALALRRLAKKTTGDARPPEVLRDRRTRFTRWAAAAALVVSATAGGYLAGRQGAAPDRTADPPALESTDALRAPAPTTVIRLQPGVEWIEGGAK